MRSAIHIPHSTTPDGTLRAGGRGLEDILVTFTWRESSDFDLRMVRLDVTMRSRLLCDRSVLATS